MVDVGFFLEFNQWHLAFDLTQLPVQQNNHHKDKRLLRETMTKIAEIQTAWNFGTWWSFKSPVSLVIRLGYLYLLLLSSMIVHCHPCKILSAVNNSLPSFFSHSYQANSVCRNFKTTSKTDTNNFITMFFVLPLTAIVKAFVNQ